MKRSARIALSAIGSVVAVLVFAAASGAADADGPNDRDIAIDGPALAQASEAALAHLGEGRVSETEIEDEESYYEVEVTLDNGREVDVQLDERFNVIGTEQENGSD